MYPTHPNHGPTDPSAGAIFTCPALQGLARMVELLPAPVSVGAHAQVVPVTLDQNVARVRLDGATASPANMLALAGSGVTVFDDGLSLRASRAGRLSVDQHGRLSVVPMLEVDGHVTPSSGPVDFEGDVLVRGDVRDNAHLRCGGTLWVTGCIEAAHLDVARDICVADGISGNNKACCSAGGNISAKHISHGNVRAGGDVTVDGTVSGSQVDCDGRLIVNRGSVVSSRVTAVGGLRCSVLGAPADGHTVIEVGNDHRLAAQAQQTIREIQQQRFKAAELRRSAEPLLRFRKHLTPTLQTQMSDLLHQAAKLDVRSAEGMEWLRVAYERMTNSAAHAIEVTQRVHGRLTLLFPRVSCRVLRERPGPIRIETRRIDGLEQVVMLDAGGEIVQVLEAQPVVNDALDAVHQATVVQTPQAA